MSFQNRNNQQVAIRFDQESAKRATQNKNGILPPLDKYPIVGGGTSTNESKDGYPILDIKNNFGSERRPNLSTQEQKRRDNLVTFWRTRGAHELFMEQNKNLANQKAKKAQEAEKFKQKKQQALKERIIEKKIEQAHLKGEIYIPEEENIPENPEKLEETSPTKPKKYEEKLKMLQKKVFVMPSGENLPKNVAFLAEKVDENRASLYYKQRKMKPGPDYEKRFGVSYEKKQKMFNTYNALYCLCNPVYQWSRTDLFTKTQEKMAEDIRRLLRYKTTDEGEPLYLMGNYRVGSLEQHETWFPIHTGFYLWFNILEHPTSKFLMPNHFTFLQFHLTEVNAKQLRIICYSIDTNNNEALRKSRTSTFPDLYYDVVKGGIYKSQLFSDTEFVVNIDITEAFEHPSAHSTCLLWINCVGKAWLGNVWAATKRPTIMFREKPDKKSTKKKLNF